MKNSVFLFVFIITDTLTVNVSVLLLSLASPDESSLVSNEFYFNLLFSR